MVKSRIFMRWVRIWGHVGFHQGWRFCFCYSLRLLSLCWVKGHSTGKDYVLWSLVRIRGQLEVELCYGWRSWNKARGHFLCQSSLIDQMLCLRSFKIKVILRSRLVVDLQWSRCLQGSMYLVQKYNCINNNISLIVTWLSKCEIWDDHKI